MLLTSTRWGLTGSKKLSKNSTKNFIRIGSSSVIGAAFLNFERSIELFDENKPGHLVSESEGAQRPDETGFFKDFWGNAIGASNDEDRFRSECD